MKSDALKIDTKINYVAKGLNIYVILICLLLFSTLIISGKLCFSSLVLFGI